MMTTSLFLIHHSSLRIHRFFLKSSGHAVNLKHERDVCDLAALLLPQEVEEDGGGGAVAVPDVARCNALAESVACCLCGCWRHVDLNFVQYRAVLWVSP